MSETGSGQRGRVRTISDGDETPPRDWRVQVGNEIATQLQRLAEDEEPEPEEQSPADRVAEMLRGAAGTRAEVKVYRRNTDGTEAFCGKYTAAEYEAGGEEMLRQAFGPGRYRVTLYADTPTAAGVKFVRRATLDLEIAAMLATAPIPGGQPSEISRALQMLIENQQRMQEQILSVVNKPPANPLDNLKETLGLMTMFREAMGGSEKSGGVMETIKAIRELKAVSDEINPKSEPDSDSPMGMFREVIGGIQTAMQLRGASQPQQPQAAFPQVTLPAFVAESGAEMPSQEPQQMQAPAGLDLDDPDMLELLTAKANLGKLIKAAGAAEIDDWADFLVEKMPDQFVELLAGENWFDLLLQLFPQAEPHREWLTSVRKKALEFLREDGALPPAA